MGYVIPTGYSRVTFSYAATNATGSAPSWGFGTDRSPDLDVLTAVSDWWVDSLAPVTNAGATLTRVEMRNDFDALSLDFALNGSDGGDFAPPQAAALVKLTSPAIGRKNRGRVFLPYVIEDSEIDAGGLLTDVLVGQLQSAWDDLVGVLDSFEMRVVILHSTEGVPSPVLNQLVQKQAATIRRRNRR